MAYADQQKQNRKYRGSVPVLPTLNERPSLSAELMPLVLEPSTQPSGLIRLSRLAVIEVRLATCQIRGCFGGRSGPPYVSESESLAGCARLPLESSRVARARGSA